MVLQIWLWSHCPLSEDAPVSAKSEHFQGGLSSSAVTRCGGAATPVRGAVWSCSSCELWGHQNVQRLLQTTELPSVPSLPTASLLTNRPFSSNASPRGFCQPAILTNELFVWPNCRTDPNTNRWVTMYLLKIIFSTSLLRSCKEWEGILSQDTHQNLRRRLSWSAP